MACELQRPLKRIVAIVSWKRAEVIGLFPAALAVVHSVNVTEAIWLQALDGIY